MSGQPKKPKFLYFKTDLQEAPDHATEIGHLIVAWGALEANLFAIFRKLLGANFNVAQAVFSNLRMFRAKSEMTVSLIAVTMPDRKVELESLLKKINKSANKRNSYVHNTWAVNEEGKACLLYYVPPDQMSLDPVPLQDLKQSTAQAGVWSEELFKFLQSLGK